MNTPLRLYTVQIVREAGRYAITDEAYEYDEQTVRVMANNNQVAYEYARSVCVLRLYGHRARVFIDQAEYNAQ